MLRDPTLLQAHTTGRKKDTICYVFLSIQLFVVKVFQLPCYFEQCSEGSKGAGALILFYAPIHLLHLKILLAMTFSLIIHEVTMSLSCLFFKLNCGIIVLL